MPNPPDNSFVDPDRPDSYVSAKLTDFSLVTSYEKFSSLVFWNKLEYLQQSADKVVLEQVKQNSPSKQLKALAALRLYKLQGYV